MILAGVRGPVIAGAVLIASILAGACSAGAGAPPAEKAPQTPSGLPVPRYVVLKFDAVNARSGPSDDHRLLWVYHTKGLPVQVVAETRDWRRICDPDGGLSWVHRRTTDGRRSVMRADADPAPIRKSPRADAPVVAYMASRALASLDHCAGDWCKVKVGSASGWAAANGLWGVAETPQCR